MPLWVGETWTCRNPVCRFVNAVLRIRCRNCKRPRSDEPMDIPRVKPWPESAVQCDGCGGHGCETCEHRGWLTEESYEHGRRCQREACGILLSPDHVAVYCTNACAQADVSHFSDERRYHYTMSMEFHATDKFLAATAAWAVRQFAMEQPYVVNVNIDDPVHEVDEEGNRV